MANPILERKLGANSLSIGTDLAVEAVFPNLPKYTDDIKYTQGDIDTYDFHIWNVYTIVRNFVNSVPNKDYTSVMRNTLFLPLLIEEVDRLHRLYDGMKCKIVMFYPVYKQVYKNYNVNKEVVNTNPYSMHLAIKSFLESDHGKKVFIQYRRPDHRWSKKYRLNNLLVTTHIPCDLFNANKTINLLESHTGVIKTKEEFNTKFHKLGSESLTSLPFMEELLYIFGDNQIVFSLPVGIRRKVVKLATEKEWFVHSKEDQIVRDIKNDSELKSILHKFNRIYDK